MIETPGTWGTHRRVLSESFPINPNMTGVRLFLKKTLRACALDESSLSIGRVKEYELRHQFGWLQLWLFVFRISRKSESVEKDDKLSEKEKQLAEKELEVNTSVRNRSQFSRSIIGPSE